MALILHPIVVYVSRPSNVTFTIYSYNGWFNQLVTEYKTDNIQSIFIWRSIATQIFTDIIPYISFDRMHRGSIY